MKYLLRTLLAISLLAPVSAVPLGNLDNGIEAKDNATGLGYIMFSPIGVQTRFSLASNRADNFVAVKYTNGIWYYDNNSSYVAFTPLPDDVLVASVDFSADTVTLLKGQNTVIHGISAGYIRGDLNIIANQWKGVFNAGEFGVTGTFIDLANVSIGNINSGIAGYDSATGNGYIMFSPDGLSQRLNYWGGQADSFTAVKYFNDQWYYDNNGGYVAFTPMPNDVLVASVDFDADTLNLLAGQNTVVHGIRAGYINGNLNILPNWFVGQSGHTGEYWITGSRINLHPDLPPIVSTFTDGAFGFDYFARQGQVHFALISPDLKNWTFLDSVMEPGDGFYHSVGMTSSSDKLFVRTVSYLSNSQNPAVEDFDNDGYTNQVELLDLGTSPLASSDTDNDGLLDEWEMYHHGDLSLTATSNTDGDWLTALEEYQQGRSPVIDDDANNDGWLDSETSKILNLDLSDAYDSADDVKPWADEDGDGIANASEVEAGTDPFDAADPVSSVYTPLVDLRASDFTSDGAVLSWNNHGSLGGDFLPGGQSPQSLTQSSARCVRFSAGTEDWLKGPRQAAQVTGAGSRTVVAWVYNPDVNPSQGDVLVSWGGVATGSPARSLFSARLSSSTANGALRLSGNSTGDQAWGNGVTPAQGQWSFVVFRYNLADGSMLVLQDFNVGLHAVPLDLDTGSLTSSDNPHHLIVGGDNDLTGGTSSQNTSLCIGRLYVYDRALPVSELVTLYNNDRSTYSKPSLPDADDDNIPDVMETSLGTLANNVDSDGDGINDDVELLQGTDPKDFFNGAAHYVQVTSGDAQDITQGQETPAAITFKVLNADSVPIANAPVNLTVPTGGGQVRLDSPGSPLNSNLSTSADANGEIKVRFKSTE